MNSSKISRRPVLFIFFYKFHSQIVFRLAQEAKRKRTSAVAGDILGQIKELLEDLGPVEEPKMDDDEWEELENDEMQS